MVKDELRNLQVDTEVMNNDIVSYIREMIQNFKDNYSLSDIEMPTLLGIDQEEYCKLISHGYNKDVSSRLISRIYLLSNGCFSIENIRSRMDRKLYNYSELLSNYRKNTRQELVNQLLDILEIKNDDELKQAIEIGKTLKETLNNA